MKIDTKKTNPMGEPLTLLRGAVLSKF